MTHLEMFVHSFWVVAVLWVLTWGFGLFWFMSRERRRIEGYRRSLLREMDLASRIYRLAESRIRKARTCQGCGCELLELEPEEGPFCETCYVRADP